jgi:hypothetical protein
MPVLEETVHRFGIGVIVLLVLSGLVGCSRADIPSIPALPRGIQERTDTITIAADDLYIDVGGQRYHRNFATIDVYADTGAFDGTLELTWSEYGREMRLQLYFAADETSWWVDEIRTYDGNEQGEWVYYTGEFFKTPRGGMFAGTVDLASDDVPRNTTASKLHISNLRLTCECVFQERPDLHKP